MNSFPRGLIFTDANFSPKTSFPTTNDFTEQKYFFKAVKMDSFQLKTFTLVLKGREGLCLFNKQFLFYTTNTNKQSITSPMPDIKSDVKSNSKMQFETLKYDIKSNKKVKNGYSKI